MACYLYSLLKVPYLHYEWLNGSLMTNESLPISRGKEVDFGAYNYLLLRFVQA
jgi:hypothetical protein